MGLSPSPDGLKKTQKLPKIPCTSLDCDIGSANEKHSVNLEFVTLALYAKFQSRLADSFITAEERAP